MKRKRKESQFEVFHHFYRLRKNLTDLLLRDFGYSERKSKDHLEKLFGGRAYDELNENEKNHYDHRFNKTKAFEDWFIVNSRDTVMNCLRNIQEFISSANSIYPTCPEELIERRIYQDKSIGQCHRLLQELQYAIETLPVDISTYIRFAEDIDKQIQLLKGWRKSNTKFQLGKL